MATEWKEYVLSDLIEIIGGGTPKTSIAEYWNGDIPWLSIKDFNNIIKYVYITEKTITDLGLNKSSTKLLQKNDIIISARGTVGELAMIPYPMAFNQSCYGIRVKEKINSDYLFYWLKNIIRKLKAISHGSVFDTITRDTFDSLTIALPPLETQQKIAKILSALDEKIELNNKINENLHAQAQAIFKSWFVDFEPFGGTMPNDWEKGKLSDVADIIMGQSPKGESYNEIGDGEVFYQGKADFTERFPVRRLYTTEPKRMVEEKSVLLSVRAPVGEINVATEKCCIGRGLASIKSKKGQNSYLLYLLYSIQSQFDIFNGEGTIFGSINKSDLGNMNIVLPAQEKISQFENIASQLDEMILTNWNENQKLAKIRDTLLPKLMSGELEV